MQHLADGAHVIGPTNEGSGNEVKVVLHRKLDVADILLSQRRQVDMHTGDVDALVGRESAAVFHGAADLRALDLLYPQGHQTVINEDLHSRLYFLMQLGIGHGHPLPVAHDVLRGQGKGISGLQADVLHVKALDTDLRTLGVHNGSHGTAHGIPHRLQLVQTAQVLLMIAVGKVKASRIHTSTDQLAHHFFALDRRAQSTNDLSLSQHVFVPPFL